MIFLIPTAQKMKKSLMENFIFYAVFVLEAVNYKLLKK